MEFMAEWKSLWPIASTFSAPLLIPNKDTKAPFGPLTFTPSPNFSTTILQSPSLSPCLPPPYPKLTLSRFLQDHSFIPSSAASIDSFLGPQLPNCSSEYHGFNSLQLLQIPNKNLVIVFFPVGENSDRVGFSLFSINDGILGVQSQRKEKLHVVEKGNVNFQRITCLSVNPVDDFFCNESRDGITKVNNVATAVGLLMVCTNYSVYWYRIRITTKDKQDEDSVCVDYVGSANAKMLMGKSVESACWSPHMREECLVLLESGDLVLFDINYSSGRKANSMSFDSGCNNFVNKKVQVPLSDKLGLKEESCSKGRQWFGCDFSWHPRIFIVCHRNEILLVDSRSAGECHVFCLLKLEMLSLRKNDGFFSLSRAGSDGFYFIVATKYMLLLGDVRKPLVPVLRWAHAVQNPRYMTVCRLSELRANAEDTKYKLASESGHCVILGSFWDNNFSLFCYGHDDNGNGSVNYGISKFCNSCYSWGFPSELSLSGCDCTCGSCLVREESWKSSLPVWTDWRDKKELVLGFGILRSDLSAQLSSSFGNFGGFSLIRLTSSGKLEAQNYLAAWGSDKVLEAGHKRKRIQLEDVHLYDHNYLEYDGVKKFQHLKFEFLNAYLKDKLAKFIVKRREKIKESDGTAQKKYPGMSKFNCHQEICQRLKAFKLSGMESSSTSSAVLKDITWPTSVHEIALRSAYAALPTKLLRLAFSTYLDIGKDSKNQKEPLEFLDIPDQLRAPPFPFRKPSNRSNKWSTKVKPSDAIVGPILPAHFLITLNELCVDELKEEREPYREETEALSAHTQFKRLCDKVVEVVQEHISGPDVKAQDNFVSLADDTEDMSYYQVQKLNLSCHNPSAFLQSPLRTGIQKPGCEDNTFTTHVFMRSQEPACNLTEEMIGKELFDVGCPIELDFDDRTIEFGSMELEMFRTLKKRDLEIQRCYKPYQEYIVGGDGLKRE